MQCNKAFRDEFGVGTGLTMEILENHNRLLKTSVLCGNTNYKYIILKPKCVKAHILLSYDFVRLSDLT